MNSILRTIELTTTMLAPIILGQLLDFIGYIWTGAFIACSSMLSFASEYFLLNGIYSQYPQLAEKFNSHDDKENEDTYGYIHQSTKDDTESNECVPIPERENLIFTVLEKIIPSVVKEAFSGWQTYFVHPVRYIL